MKNSIILLLTLLSLSAGAQVRVKPTMDIGAGFDSDHLFTANWGVTIEKKLDINKSIETGYFYHNFELNFPKDQYGFYDAFVKGTENDKYRDSISDFRVTFNFATIPIGFNYYTSPKVYWTYKIGFNFFNTGNFKGEYIDSTNIARTLYKDFFDVKSFKKFYINHTISVNRIIWRRFDAGLGVMFTPQKSFVIDKTNPVFQAFDKEVSQYFAISLHFKIFLFQIKATEI